ncbi:patatin-like phospholipase family protein [Vibrio sp. ZSDE26]|uniref:Patatin-like phospholipase family protein n=1 Tax=Vibrio amylolyticus TaxID=2847292 RepID=A0A9X1XNY9_9VIBR|nr:patatin-like phospholipase family protein [Vibrio amylolyticus]MCK6262929.1 patatin-like phospholipase family protein [Vibrio amylolyticus]
MKRHFFLILTLLISGCSSRAYITNPASSDSVYLEASPYSLEQKASQLNQSDTLVLVSFSGGGTRAAALSYGVLKGLNDYELEDTSLLEQVSVISSVSGGSFTAAYYGIHGNEIFNHYEEDFLYRDVSRGLLDILLSPSYWFSSLDRSTAAANFYHDELFDQATFSDMSQDGPMIVINATDLGGGVRFSFIQEYFDLLCTDLNDYSVAQAVTASSAVPFIFQPVVLQNHSGCNNQFNHPLDERGEASLNSAYLASTKKGLASYSDKEERPYVHLIDGGITDNLGVLALYDVIEAQMASFSHMKSEINNIVIISVDASTQPDWNIDQSSQPPSTKNTLGAVTDIQLHRYNDLTKRLINERLIQWEQKESHRSSYFIDINLLDAHDREALFEIPTDFSLEEQQVDALIQHGYQAIMSNETLDNLLTQ